jgi:hypothetical protein
MKWSLHVFAGVGGLLVMAAAEPALAQKHYTEEEERAYWQDFIAHVREMTGKRLKGRLGGGAGYTVRTDDLMAEAGCLYHTSWIIDDQPWPARARKTRA